MKIAVDVDDTVVDLLGPWLSRYNRTYNDILLPEDLTEWDLTKAVKPECGEKIYELLDGSLYDHVLPLPGARQGILKLAAAGHEVTYVTTCTAGTVDAKYEWLVRWGFLARTRFHKGFIATADKTIIAADVLFDDKVETVETFPGMAFLVNQPQNRHVACTRERLSTMLDAHRAITWWQRNSPYRDAA